MTFTYQHNQLSLDEIGHVSILLDEMGLDKMGLDEMGINRQNIGPAIAGSAPPALSERNESVKETVYC